MSYTKSEVRNMCVGAMRGFLTKEEKVEMLKEYKESLEKEAEGVEERIKELEKGFCRVIGGFFLVSHSVIFLLNSPLAGRRVNK